MDKAQTTSTDAFVAVALFILVVILFFSVSREGLGQKKAESLNAELTKLVSSLSAKKDVSESLLIGTSVNEQRLQELSSLEYRRLKDALGVDTDFCIYFEDDGGNVIAVNEDVAALGSKFARVGETLCGGLSAAEKIICEEAENTGKCSEVGDFALTPQQCCAFTGRCCS